MPGKFGTKQPGKRPSTPRKGADNLHALREAKHANSGTKDAAGVKIGGRPSMMDDERVYDRLMEAAAVRMTPADASRFVRGNVNLVTNWLNRADAAAELGEDETTNKYIKFQLDWNEARTNGLHGALGTLMRSPDPKYVERWIARTDDELSYVDRDKLIGRPEINVGILPGLSAGIDLARSLGAARNAHAVREAPEVVEGTYTEREEEN